MKDEARDAKEIISKLSYLSLFTYIPEMEISVHETDRKNSMDRIAHCFRNDEITLSDLFIGYAVSLYKYTIPKIVADTIPVLGRIWPEKNVPRYISRDDLANRLKKLCRMGLLRRFVFQKAENNIVLYSNTVELSKIIMQTLKLNTDARHEKDILPPIEILEKAASSLVTCELLKSPNLKGFNFMPLFQDERHEKTQFYAQISHEVEGQDYLTVVEPAFTKVDSKRFTESEWNEYRIKKIGCLRKFMEHLSRDNTSIQAIVLCEDIEDFKKVSTAICTIFEERLLPHIYFTSEGALKSGGELRNSLIRIISAKPKPGDSGKKVLGSVTSSLAYLFY